MSGFDNKIAFKSGAGWGRSPSDAGGLVMVSVMELLLGCPCTLGAGIGTDTLQDIALLREKTH